MAGLTRDDIDHILKLIDGSDFDALKLEMGDIKLELRKPGAASPAPVAAPALPASAPISESARAPAPSAAPAPVANANGTPVPSPLLGIFYHAPKPGAAPFVAVGDQVTPDTVIGIVEVMKLMNQVHAGVSGTVTQITAPNGELVEHGQTLILVQPA